MAFWGALNQAAGKVLTKISLQPHPTDMHINRSFEKVRTVVNPLVDAVQALQSPAAFAALGTLNSFAPGSVTPASRINPINEVELEGVVVSPAGGSSSTILNLPSGSRPKNQRTFACVGNNSGTLTTYWLAVNGNGNVTPLAAIPAAATVDLSAIKFFAEQ